MGRIETYQRRQRMPMGAPAVPISKWDEYALTAEQQAITGVGETIGGVAVDWVKQLANAEYSRGKAHLYKGYEDYFDSLSNRTDFLNFPKDHEKFRKTLEKEVLGHGTLPGVQESLKDLIWRDLPVMQERLRRRIADTAKTEARAKILGSVEDFVDAGNLPGASAALIEATQYGALTNEEAEEWLIQTLLARDPETGIARDPETALEYIKAAQYIDPARKNQLSSSAHNAIKQREAKTKKTDAQKQQAIYDDFTNKLIANDLNFAEIEGTGVLSDDIQVPYWIKLAKADVKPTQTDAQTYLEVEEYLLRYLLREPGFEDWEMAYETLLDARYINRKLSDDDFKELLTRLRATYEKDILKNAHKVILANTEKKRLRWDKPRSEVLRANKAFFAWLDRQLAQEKEPTLHEMQGQMQYLSIPERPKAVPQTRNDAIMSFFQYHRDEIPKELLDWVQEEIRKGNMTQVEAYESEKFQAWIKTQK